MKILAIETSCDESAAAVVEDGHLVLGEAVASQVEVHRKYGGVVPELASRNHVVDIVPVIQEAMRQAQLPFEALDAIAVTRGPGLVGALLVGLQVAKGLAYAHGKALIPVHHLSGHLHAIFLHRPGEPRPEGPAGPFLALSVSGGHTALYHVHSDHEITQVANTRDDAAGEAFDKVARMLGLGYPGGPTIERMACGGDPAAIPFTLARFKDGALDFSFSGLKTAVRTALQRHNAPDVPAWARPALDEHATLPEGQDLADLLASFQSAAAAQLVDRTVRAAQKFGLRDVALVGGVACNQTLRAQLDAALRAQGARLYVPPPRWCTDNAAMIGAAAFPLAQRRLRAQGGLGPLEADRRLNAVGSWPLPLAAAQLP